MKRTAGETSGSSCSAGFRPQSMCTESRPNNSFHRTVAASRASPVNSNVRYLRSPLQTHNLRSSLMHLITNGMIATRGTKCPGKLLLTEGAIFVLKETVSPGPASALFGILGGLVATLIGRASSGKTGPAFLSDPDLNDLNQRDRRALFGTEKLVKYALTPTLAITPTKMGFSFNDGMTGARFDGFMHKKKVAAFLQSRGVSIGT